MAVALVHGTVCGEEVEVMLVLRIPDAAATCSREYCKTCQQIARLRASLAHTNGKRVIVVCCEVMLCLNGRLRRGSMVPGGVWCAGGVKGAGSWLQSGAVAISNNCVVLKCAWSHGGER